jgi:aromatic ring-opening dioxygenase catalytic subunit (LigB family)
VAQVIAGFGVPHTPEFPALVEREGPQSETAQLYRAVAQQIEAARPDVLVIFTSDHLNTFFLNNYPAMCVGVTDRTSGPNDGTRMPDYTVPVSEQLADHVYGFGIENGFDLSVAQEFDVDHTVMVPLHFLTPTMSIPIVPIFINGIVHPLPGARRCHALGRTVRRAVEQWPSDVSVAVLASGSFSLDIGGSLAPLGQYAGTPDEDWARTVLAYLQNGKTDDLLNEATSDRMARAGNVAGELLNWIAVLGATGPQRPAFLEPQLERGHAFAAWRWD